MAAGHKPSQSSAMPSVCSAVSRAPIRRIGDQAHTASQVVELGTSRSTVRRQASATAAVERCTPPPGGSHIDHLFQGCTSATPCSTTTDHCGKRGLDGRQSGLATSARAGRSACHGALSTVQISREEMERCAIRGIARSRRRHVGPHAASERAWRAAHLGRYGSAPVGALPLGLVLPPEPGQHPAGSQTTPRACWKIRSVAAAPQAMKALAR
jgi:hypothetical protein